MFQILKHRFAPRKYISNPMGYKNGKYSHLSKKHKHQDNEINHSWHEFSSLKELHFFFLKRD